MLVRSYNKRDNLDKRIKVYMVQTRLFSNLIIMILKII